MKNTDFIIRNHQTIAKKIQNEFIIIDPNKGNLFKLNTTAQAIWKYTRIQKSVKEIVHYIVNEFSVSEKKAQEDVIQFINKHLNILFFVINK